MTEEQKFNKFLTIQNSLWTAICCIDEVLQDENKMPHQISGKNVHLLKLHKDLLTTKARIDPHVDAMNKNLDFTALDFSNQISYIIEDVVNQCYDSLKMTHPVEVEQ
jgi:hypothetical protein